MVGDVPARQDEGVPMGKGDSVGYAIASVTDTRYEAYQKSIPPMQILPAVYYADDGNEIMLDNISWMETYYEPLLMKMGMSLESSPPVDIVEGMRTQHMQYEIVLQEGVLHFIYNPKDKGMWRYPVITPLTRRYLAVPVLMGILCSYWDYTTLKCEIPIQLQKVIPVLKKKNYSRTQWRLALLLFCRRRKIPLALCDILTSIW